MAFWNDKITEPKRKFRWLLSVGGIPYYTIKKVNRPTYEIAEAEHKFINHTFYFPGRVTYNTISFTIVDTASPDAAETLKQMLYGAGYALPKNENVATQTITKHGGVTALGDVKIELLGGGGKLLAEGHFNGLLAATDASPRELLKLKSKLGVDWVSQSLSSTELGQIFGRDSLAFAGLRVSGGPGSLKLVRIIYEDIMRLDGFYTAAGCNDLPDRCIT